jgi:predicted PurR-regulated permease PerM
MADVRLPRLPPMSHYAKVTLTVVAVLAAVRAAWAVRNIIVLIVVALVLAVGLDPAVRRLERWRIKRGWAVAIIFAAAIGFLVLFALLVIPPLVREVRELAAKIPEYVNRLKEDSGFFGDLERKYQISKRLRELTANLPSLASSSLGTVLGITKSIGTLIFNTLTIGILTIYFLSSLPRGHRAVVQLFSRERRELDRRVLEEALERVGGYVSGNILISIIAGVAAFIALAIIGVPFAAALAMWVAIADLIPSVGATLGALVAVIVAGFSGLGDLVATIIYFVVYQQVENYVIAPRVMKKSVDLSPAAVIISVLIGGSLAGFAGALLALPIAAAGKVVVKDLWLNRRLEESELVASTGGAGGPPAGAPAEPI